MRASAAAAVMVSAAMLLAACERTDTVQRGYRGLAQVQLYKASQVQTLAELNKIPPPEDPADLDSPTAAETFENIQVLKDLSATEVSRLMQALTTWVAPDEGCDFCHNPDNLASDEKYPKVVARRMFQMTRQINTEWQAHVGKTGVTCWTCHRGQAVPTGDWFAGAAPEATHGQLGYRGGQNLVAPQAGYSSLPGDPLSAYLTNAGEVRVQGTQPLAGSHRDSIKSAEWTYALMIYMSQSLGVNCTYCHNTRALARWDESTPQRSTAWYGIRMVRQLNGDYLEPIAALLPAHRMGPLGDGPKVGCATCHKGTYKPLNGISPLNDYRELAGVKAPAAGAVSTITTAQTAAPAQR